MDMTLFPISMEKHIIFCVAALIFFLVQFIRTKRWYQLILAIAIPASLLIYLQPENETIFYAVGIGEAVILALAFIINLIQSAKLNRAEKEKKKAAQTVGTEA